MILVLDNYDSFTFNLVQYIGAIHPAVKVIRNDELGVREILAMEPSHIVVSPGPCTPDEAGVSIELIRAIPVSIPLLGVCLGHQAIGAAFGGTVLRAPKPMHGKTSKIKNDGQGVFAGLPGEFTATRYHSLIVEIASLPHELEAAAHSEDGILMAVRHRSRPIHGLQFHPESILTEHGKTMIGNFLKMKGQ